MRALKTREGYLQNLITSDNHHTPWAHSVCNYLILIGRRLVSSPGSSLRPAFIQSPRRRRANQTYPRSEQVSYPGPRQCIPHSYRGSNQRPEARKLRTSLGSRIFPCLRSQSSDRYDRASRPSLQRVRVTTSRKPSLHQGNSYRHC